MSMSVPPTLTDNASLVLYSLYFFYFQYFEPSNSSKMVKQQAYRPYNIGPAYKIYFYYEALLGL